jgi:hypothetical protein
MLTNRKEAAVKWKLIFEGRRKLLIFMSFLNFWIQLEVITPNNLSLKVSSRRCDVAFRC